MNDTRSLLVPLSSTHAAIDAGVWDNASVERGRWWRVLWGEIVQLWRDVRPGRVALAPIDQQLEFDFGERRR